MRRIKAKMETMKSLTIGEAGRLPNLLPCRLVATFALDNLNWLNLELSIGSLRTQNPKVTFLQTALPRLGYSTTMSPLHGQSLAKRGRAAIGIGSKKPSTYQILN